MTAQTCEYLYPYSAYIARVLDAEEFSYELYKHLTLNPDELKYAVQQLKLYCQHYGFPPDLAIKLLTELRTDLPGNKHIVDALCHPELFTPKPSSQNIQSQVHTRNGINHTRNGINHTRNGINDVGTTQTKEDESCKSAVNTTNLKTKKLRSSLTFPEFNLDQNTISDFRAKRSGIKYRKRTVETTQSPPSKRYMAMALVLIATIGLLYTVSPDNVKTDIYSATLTASTMLTNLLYDQEKQIQEKQIQEKQIQEKQIAEHSSSLKHNDTTKLKQPPAQTMNEAKDLFTEEENESELTYLNTGVVIRSHVDKPDNQAAQRTQFDFEAEFPLSSDKSSEVSESELLSSLYEKGRLAAENFEFNSTASSRGADYFASELSKLSPNHPLTLALHEKIKEARANWEKLSRNLRNVEREKIIENIK